MALTVGGADNSFEAPEPKPGFRWVHPTPDTTWLDPESTSDLEWRLRHSPGFEPTMSERMVLASALACYRELARLPRVDFQRVKAAIREANRG